jgi:hypothetical protein
LNEVLSEVDDEKLCVHVLLAEANRNASIHQRHFPPKLTHLRDVVKRVDVADGLEVANEVLREASAMRILSE